MRKPKDTIKMADECMVICKAIKSDESEYIVRVYDDGHVEFLKSLYCMWSLIITPRYRVGKYFKNIVKYILDYNLSSTNKIIKFVIIPVTNITLSTKRNVIMSKEYIDSLEKSINAKPKINEGENKMIKNNIPKLNAEKRKGIHTIQDCKDYLKSSNLIKMYKIDPNDDSSVEKQVRSMIDDIKEQFGNTTLTEDQTMNLLYDRILQADRSCTIHDNNVPYSAVGSYGSFFQHQPYGTGHNYIPYPLAQPLLFNNYKNSFPEETSFQEKFNIMKMVLESGKEYYINTTTDGEVYASKKFDLTALYRTSDLLKCMGGIFEFVKSFDSTLKDKVKVVLNIAVNINPSSDIYVSKIYEREN